MYFPQNIRIEGKSYLKYGVFQEFYFFAQAHQRNFHFLSIDPKPWWVWCPSINCVDFMVCIVSHKLNQKYIFLGNVSIQSIELNDALLETGYFIVTNSAVAKVIQPANFEDRLILIFLSSLDLELMKNARSPKIWAP